MILTPIKQKNDLSLIVVYKFTQYTDGMVE